MKDASQPISLGVFVLVLLCSLLPFARVSCNKQFFRGIRGQLQMLAGFWAVLALFGAA